MGRWRRLLFFAAWLGAVSSACAQDGEGLYSSRCANCHEGPLRLALGAPDLEASLPAWTDFLAVLREGKGAAMPSFPPEDLSNADLEAIFIYLGGELPSGPVEEPPASEPPEPAEETPRSSEVGSSQFELPGGSLPIPLPPGGSSKRPRLPLPPATPQHVRDYKQHCESCHGDIESPEPYDWFGNGGISAYTRSDFPNLRHITMDFGTFRRIMERGSEKGMPAYPAFTGRSARDAGFALYKHIEDNAEPDDPYRRACNAEQRNIQPHLWAGMLWKRACARCHGVDYEGEGQPIGRNSPIRPLSTFDRPSRGQASDFEYFKNWLFAGHRPSGTPKNAPRFPQYAESDAASLYALMSVRAWGIEDPDYRTPAHDRFWRGETCHAQRCQVKKREIDDLVRAVIASGDKRPIAGTKGCARKIRRNRRDAGRGVELCIASREIGEYMRDCGPYVRAVSVRAN